MKVAVLGSNSFSGSDFIDLLLSETEAEVLGVSRSPEKPAWQLPYRWQNSSRFNFVQANIATEGDALLEVLRGFQADYIVNFMAQSEVGPSWDNPDHWFDTNVTALSRFITGLLERGCPDRYVHISSPEVYGPCAAPLTEDAPMNPSTPYAVSKAAADMLLSIMRAHRGLPLVTVRATNVYGPCQQLFKIIPRSVIYRRMGKVIPLHGGGTAVKSYIHIRDVSRGTLRIMMDGRLGETYHLSPDEGLRVRDVVRRICDLMGDDFSAATRDSDERLAQDAAYLVDSTKARRAFGWTPGLSLDEGVAQVIAWIDSNWSTIRTETLDYVHKR